VLDAICEEFTFAASSLGVLRLNSGKIAIEASARLDREWLARASERGSEVVAMWGGPQRMLEYPLDEPIVQAEVMPNFREMRYYREMAEPIGLVDQAAMLILRDGVSFGNVSFGRHRSAGPIGKLEVDGLRILAPHFRRAVTISDLFGMKAIEAASFGSVLDGLRFGVVLVDEHAQIVHANAPAQAMLSSGDPIRSARGTLTLAMPAAQSALERAVYQASRDETGLGPRGIGIPARSVAGEPCVVHVLPLRRSEARAGIAQRATVALFVAPATAPPRMPIDGLALIYDLTPAEARVFEMISAGATQAAIAHTLGIARSTVKSHLLHLFEKTGCKRQVDLVRLAARLSVPV
jgi:DNA-binding CsgD family transcriptional regulator